MFLPNMSVSTNTGTSSIALKAMKDHGIISKDNVLSITIASSNRIRRAYLNARLMSLFEKFEDVEFYEEAAEICKKIIELQLDYPDSMIINNSVNADNDDIISAILNKKVAPGVAEQIDRLFKEKDPANIPLHVRQSIIDHYIDLTMSSPLITEDDFRISTYGSESLTSTMLDDPEYRSKVIRTVVSSFCNTDNSEEVAENILSLGLSYKEIMMGGYMISVINRVRQGMRKTNEEFGDHDNLIMKNIYNVCIPYSLGIALKEYTPEDLRVKLKETLKMTEENV